MPSVRSPQMPLKIVVCLLIWLSCSGARAQPVLEPELQRTPPPGVNDPEPSPYVPLALLVPGVVALVTGGALFGSPLGLVSEARDGVFIGLMASGAALVLGSTAFFTVRLIKRARWRHAQAWLRC